jgi:hypothetical protein
MAQLFAGSMIAGLAFSIGAGSPKPILFILGLWLVGNLIFLLGTLLGSKRLVVGILAAFIAVAMSNATVEVPIGSSAAEGFIKGSAAGGAVGTGTWLVIGTVGVALFGTAIALGWGAQTLIGAVLGGIGGLASYSQHMVTVPKYAPSEVALVSAIAGALIISGLGKLCSPTPDTPEGQATKSIT